jgi:hypothetical protein
MNALWPRVTQVAARASVASLKKISNKNYFVEINKSGETLICINQIDELCFGNSTVS